MARYLFGNYSLDVDERRLLRDNEESAFEANCSTPFA